MVKLPSSFGMLLLAFATDAFASEEKKRERPIRPTPSELQAFELPPPEVDLGPTPSKSAWFELSGVGLIAASAADFTTTEWGLSRGLREGNPLASQRGVRLVHHVAGPAAVYWTTEHLRKKGRTRLALTLRIALMAAYSYAATHNLHQMNGLSVSR